MLNCTSMLSLLIPPHATEPSTTKRWKRATSTTASTPTRSATRGAASVTVLANVLTVALAVDVVPAVLPAVLLIVSQAAALVMALKQRSESRPRFRRHGEEIATEGTCTNTRCRTSRQRRRSLQALFRGRLLARGVCVEAWYGVAASMSGGCLTSSVRTRRSRDVGPEVQSIREWL
jgi:hypothetical protein